MTFDQFLQYIFSGITSGSVYALTAIGFTLVFSATQIINFAQGQMVMLGGMLGVSLYSAGLPLWACFLGAVVIVALISVGMEEVAIRPLLKKGVLAQIIATVGASFVLETAAMLIWGRDAKTLPAFSGETAHHHRTGDHRPSDSLGPGPHRRRRGSAHRLLSEEPLRHGDTGLCSQPGRRPPPGHLVPAGRSFHLRPHRRRSPRRPG